MLSQIHQESEKLVKFAHDNGIIIVTAESCTGGMVASSIVDIAGSSSVFERGFVTYANEAKIEMLGVSSELIENNGAVSKQVAGAMAEGALANSYANLSVAITGIAGPDGGSQHKPVGFVCFAVASKIAETFVEERVFAGNRMEIRQYATIHALYLMLQCSKKSLPS